ncbi:hypothetical protein [Mesorhizobium sp. CA7]|uniref:hypothetical protein n=1 Tax=Mesorhizobium sp. CA7 TaxID=588501 RepID=UPI001CCF5C32|nr:hypothetical protein [Mesorhizobium sp. CA7]MBZ9815272.1 hypothetical protein [Mesorhizobium sp. CA7]
MKRPIVLKNAVVELASVGIFGAMVGAAIMLFLADKVVSVSESATLASGFGGAVLGSGISAFVSFVLARQTSREALERNESARLAEQEASALRLMVKASLVLSDITAIQKVIDQSLSEANDRGLTSEPFWKRVLPIVGSYQIYDVDAAELTPLIAAKNNELMHNAVTLFMQHRNLVESVKVYSEKRELVKSIVTRHKVEEGGVITSGVTEEELSRLTPLAVELESLIIGIREMLPDLTQIAEAVTFGTGPAMRKFFGNGQFPIFAPRDVRPATTPAA